MDYLPILTLYVLMTCCCAAKAEVEGEALNIPAELGKSLKLQCAIPNGSRTDRNFRWAVDGNFTKVDLANKTESTLTISNFSEDFLVNRTIICYYDEGMYTFDYLFFRKIAQYFPEKPSLSFKYIPCNNTVKYEVKFYKVFPVPTCTLYNKKMKTEVTANKVVYSVSASIEWSMKIFRCLDLMPECHLEGKLIPNGELQNDCHEALQQSYWGVSLSVFYVIVEVAILLFVRRCYKGEEIRHDDLLLKMQDWSMTTKIQYLSAIASLVGNPFVYGYNMAVLNNPAVVIAMSVLRNNETTSVMDILEDFEEDPGTNFLFSLVIVLYVLFGIFGVLLATTIAKKFGRKIPLMVNSILMVIASVLGLCIMYPEYKLVFLFVHRSLIGFSCGLGLVISGMYTMEVSRFTVNSVKGSFGTYDRWFHFCITLGIVVASLLGTSNLFGNLNLWPWLLFLNIIPALFNLMLFWCPESPFFVYDKNKPSLDKLRTELRKICKDHELDTKIEIIKQQARRLDLEEYQGISICNLIKKRQLRVGLVIVCFLHAAQQLSGINIIVAYSSFVYQHAGVQFELAEWIVFGTALTNCISTFITLSSKESRRHLLLGSMMVMGVAMLVQFVTSNLCQNFQETCPFFSITAISLYVVAFSIGLGPIPFIMVQEIFNPEDQGAVFSISILVNWICNCLVLLFFKVLQMLMRSYIHIPYLAIVIVLLFFIYYGVPETLGLHAVDIENKREYKFWKKFACLNDDRERREAAPLCPENRGDNETN